MASTPHIISVGGSIVIPKTGFDPAFLKQFRKTIISRVKAGDRFILIVGGGTTARQYQDAAKNVVRLSNDDLDWIGIHTTIYNAHFLRILFGEYAYKEVVTNPRKKVSTTKPIIIAAGEKPGSSTDYRAVIFAKTYGADRVLNLSNIDYAYDKDPREFPDAKQLTTVDWASFRQIVGDTWTPGHSAPFDPIASALAEKLHLEVGILNGTNLAALKNALTGKSYKGTIISHNSV